MTWRYAGAHCPYALVIFARCPLLQLSAIETRALISQRDIPGVELAAFFEDLDQMELARIPNDREQKFFD
jgi:hypothetical protein